MQMWELSLLRYDDGVEGLTTSSNIFLERKEPPVFRRWSVSAAVKDTSLHVNIMLSFLHIYLISNTIPRHPIICSSGLTLLTGIMSNLLYTPLLLVGPGTIRLLTLLLLK